jgi:DNA-binding response OmpR family regulator
MASLKFLVVDDATFIRDLLKKNLRDNFPGCEVLDAPSAKKAQFVLKTNRVDLILSDWEMPEMSGEEFLRWIRSQEKYADLPFIMVTSRGERDFIVRAVEAGVNDYMGKPFTPESLVTKVTKALQKVGKSVKTASVTRDGRVDAAGSLEILVSGGSAVAQPTVSESTSNDSVDVLTGGGKSAVKPQKVTPASQPKSASKKSKAVARGQAQLTFAAFTSQCIINDISLQMLRCAIKRTEKLPAIFETVVISIVQNDGQDVARLNGYVHSIEAAENHMDAGVLRLTIRFVDDDTEKLEHLSRYIAKL